MKKIRIVFIYFLIFLSSFLLTSCKHEENRLYLTDFEYSLSGRYGPFYSIENNDLQKLYNYVPNREGFIWIRTYFELPEDLENRNLGIYLGITKIAEYCYINGNYIGKTGELPPKEFSSGEIPTYFSIPPSTLNYDGDQNLLELYFWVNSQGKMDNKPFISNYDDIYNTYISVGFKDSKVCLIVSYIMIVVSFIYIILYLFRRKEKANLSFSRLNFCSALYMMTMCVGEYSRFTETSYLFYLKTFNGFAAVICSYFAVSFIRDYFGHVDTLKRKIYRISITVIPCIALALPKTLHYFFIILGFAYISITIHILYAVKIIIIEIKRRNKKFNTLIIGFTPVLVSLVVEIILFFMDYPFAKLIVVIGWQLTILTFLAILIISFAKTSTEIEFFKDNLEKLVQDRTMELQSTNELLEETNTHLEFERERAQKEIDLAAFVQQSFYNKLLPKVDDWDFDYYFKALAGVSGDMYDFYIDDDKLKGFGIFDVSGHGISSGLVTMLVKNIIQQEFFAGKEYPLPDIMDIINNRVIEEKGNIENYLTGILARVISPQKVEFVNGGHTYPIFYSASENRAYALSSESSSKCGVIGIADFPTIFETQYIDFAPGDALLLYTDGITEATNAKKEEYGIDRLIKQFEKNQDLNIQAQIDFILNDIYTFANTEKIDDDITIIILRKK